MVAAPRFQGDWLFATVEQFLLPVLVRATQCLAHRWVSSPVKEGEGDSFDDINIQTYDSLMILHCTPRDTKHHDEHMHKYIYKYIYIHILRQLSPEGISF